MVTVMSYFWPGWYADRPPLLIRPGSGHGDANLTGRVDVTVGAGDAEVAARSGAVIPASAGPLLRPGAARRCGGVCHEFRKGRR